MASEVEAFRTLGLAPGASQAEIKRAYRRLAKTFHPDAAGQEAIPRFLAIQAAYEILTGTSLGRRRWTPPPTTWQADPERARATRDAWRGRRTTSDSSADGARRTSGRTSSTGPRGGATRPRRETAPGKATPGSTTYDAADDEPFDPEWSGASWYGTSSGTYWTINPREYADPRKHGPEYQARGRRAAGTAEPRAADDTEAAFAASAGAADAAGADTRRNEQQTGAPRPRYQAPPNGPPPPRLDDAPPPRVPFAGRVSLAGRVPLALIGWPPIGVLVAAAIGNASGCSRFAAGCSEDAGVLIWLSQLAVVLVLLAVPRLAAISTLGTLVALATAVPATLLLSVGGGAQERAASIAALSVVLTFAYLVGVGYGVLGGSRRLRP